MKKSSFFICLLLTISCYVVRAVVVGSNTAPSRQSATTFIGASNEMRGFVAMDGGFSLSNASARCLFNAYFPVGGTVAFNGGTLDLGLDLIFASTATITTAGLINGNNLEVQLPYKNGTFTLNGMIFNGAKVVCGSDLILNGLMRFNGTSSLDAQGKTIDCSNGGIVVGASGTLLIENAILKNIRSGRFFCVDSAGTFSFSNTTIIQDSTLSFSQGRIIVLDSLVMTGSQIFVYQSSAASSIQTNAQWYFDSGMSFSYVPPISAKNLITMQSRTSVLSFNTTSLYSTSTGLQLTVGTLRLDGTCPVRSDARVAAEAITLGDGVNGNNDLLVDVLAESGFNLISGLIVYNNVNG